MTPFSIITSVAVDNYHLFKNAELRLARNATEKERHRFHPAGWTAVADKEQ